MYLEFFLQILIKSVTILNFFMEDLEFWEGHLEISRQPCGGGEELNIGRNNCTFEVSSQGKIIVQVVEYIYTPALCIIVFLLRYREVVNKNFPWAQ